MNYNKWINSVPSEIKDNSLWKMEAYRLSLFLSDICWYDITKLMKDRRTIKLSDQLYRAVGSISANIAEGYSRGTGKDRARFYEYSLGSARESRDWYYKSRHILGDLVLKNRLTFTTQIIKLLLKMVPNQRQYKISEPDTEYSTNINKILNQKIPLS